MTPFLTFYTPTYRRPSGLARCLASVSGQTLAGRIQQIVIPDHVGVGIDGMYARVPDCALAVAGRYVHLLCDDDVLADETAVADVERFAQAHDYPAVILVLSQKNGSVWPVGQMWPPVCGQIDLGCLIVRSDVWKAHCHEYGRRYEGDYDFAAALHRAGHEAKVYPRLFVIGGVSHGAAE